MGELGVSCYFLFLAHHIFIISVMRSLNFDKIEHPDILLLKQFGLRFFTAWNIIFYYVVCVVQNLVSVRCKRRKFIEAFRTYFFASLIFPGSFFMFVFFWGVYFVDRELIFPEVFESVVPKWLNHCLHTISPIMVFVENLKMKRKEVDHTKALFVMFFFSTLYFCVLFGTYFQHGVWLYGVFGTLSLIQHVFFAGFCYTVGVFAIKISFLLQGILS